MPTIASENAKPIRQAMTVLCGMDVATNIIPSATAVSSYDSYNGDVTGVPLFTAFMDLSGAGFLNDGAARPLESNHAGIVANVNAAGNSSTLQITVTLNAIAAVGTKLTLYYYENTPEMKKLTLDIAGTTASTTITSSVGRINLVKITAGDSWWFNNDSLISCTVSLRAVETRRDNPELQMSDIEIVGYEPNNILQKAANIGDNTPVYYTCGYPGDMSPVRKFYLSEKLKWSDKMLTIKAEDATKFLDKEFVGQYIGNADGDGGGGMQRYFTALHNMVTNAGIAHEFDDDIAGGPFADGDAIFIPAKSKRTLIAQAVNLFRFPVNIASHSLWFNYVDAGIPKMTVWPVNEYDYWTIDDIADLAIESDRRLKQVTIPWKPVIPDAVFEAVETVKANGTVIRNTSAPYYAFRTSAGTLTTLSPYSYKLVANGTANITGKEITIYDQTRTWNNIVPGGVDTLELEEFFAGPFPAEDVAVYYGALEQIAVRDLEVYTFNWRGDPRVQPRDYIKVKIDGAYVNMTIDTVTLEHSNGGLTSQIVARKGWI